MASPLHVGTALRNDLGLDLHEDELSIARASNGAQLGADDARDRAILLRHVELVRPLLEEDARSCRWSGREDGRRRRGTGGRRLRDVDAKRRVRWKRRELGPKAAMVLFEATLSIRLIERREADLWILI